MRPTLLLTRKQRKNAVITDTVVDPSTSSVVPTHAEVTTGDSFAITITARNAAGQPLAGKAVTSVTLSPPGSGSVSGTGNTSVTGRAYRVITAADIADGNTITVVVDGVTLDDVPVFDVNAAPSGGEVWAAGVWAGGVWATGTWAGDNA